MTCITYFVVIFGGRYLMTNVPAFKLQVPFMIHNILLTIVSGILLVLMVEQIFPIFYRQGLLAAICAYDTWTQPLELLYYLNYLVKYWELIDTIFLVLKKKNLGELFLFYFFLLSVGFFRERERERRRVIRVKVFLFTLKLTCKSQNSFIIIIILWLWFFASLNLTVELLW